MEKCKFSWRRGKIILRLRKFNAKQFPGKAQCLDRNAKATSWLACGNNYLGVKIFFSHPHYPAWLLSPGPLCTHPLPPKQRFWENLSSTSGTPTSLKTPTAPTTSGLFLPPLSPTQLCSLIPTSRMAKLKVQSEDQAAWADDTEGPGTRPSGHCCVWLWEERKHRLQEHSPMARVRGNRERPEQPGPGYPDLRTSGPHAAASVLTCKAMLSLTNPDPNEYMCALTQNTPTCVCLHTLLTSHILPLQRDSSHHFPTSGKINPSESTWHRLPLQRERVLPPLLCLVFGFQRRQGVNTASLKP